MSAQMTADNPYSAPGAELGGGQSELYLPSIFSFNGRIGRLRYMAYGIGSYLLLMLIMIPVGGSSVFMGEPAVSSVGAIAMGIISIAMLVAGVAFAKRRLNDLNRSGWWILLSIVPFVNLLFTIYIIFFPGTDGDNNFGAAPAANSLGVQILGWLIPALFVIGIVAAVVIPLLAGM